MPFTLFQLALLSGLLSTGHDPYSNATLVHEWTYGAADDRDFDHQPDDWTRRRGPGFPRYVNVVVDRERGRRDSASLRFDANGGRATYYSPLVPIDPQHTFLFEAYARSRGLRHDGGLLTISFLDHTRRRVATFRSSAVSGTHPDWVRLRVGPMEPPPTARFVVVACHLVPNERSDVDGSCWFDDLQLLQTPRLTLTTDDHFVERREPFEVRVLVGGIRDGRDYRLETSVRDGDGRVVDRSERRLKPPTELDEAEAEAACTVHCVPPPVEIDWTIPPRDHGHYSVDVLLVRDDEPILERSTSFAVMDPVDRRPTGDFGWATPSTTLSSIDTRRFTDMVTSSGVHWVKHPVWKLASDGSRDRVLATSKLLGELQSARVRLVGVLGEPPIDVRRKFADDWTGVAEVFTAPPETWSLTLDPVLARFASHIRDWQLGLDDDRSFVGQPGVEAVLRATKKEIDRIGRDSRVGVRWTWSDSPPPAVTMSRSFLSMYDDRPESPSALESRLADGPNGRTKRWIVIAPLARSKHALGERIVDLVRRMVVAKAGGVEAIFAYDVFDEEHGLLRNDGSPHPLYLPWRTTATTLSGARYLGRLQLPGGSTCHAFDSNGEGVLVAWNDSAEAAEDGLVEETFLGESAYVVDPFGRARQIAGVPTLGGQRFVVTPSPVFVRGLSAAVLEWRIRVRPRNGRVHSSTARQDESFLGRNTFPQGVGGRARLILPREWEADPAEWTFQLDAGEDFELPTAFELPPNATLGGVPIGIEFDIAADRPYRFRVHRELEVGFGDLLLKVVSRPLPDGRLEVEQIVTNKIEPPEVLDLECTLLVPGMQRQRRFVIGLAKGEDRKLYHLPNAESFRGRDFWVRARQQRGRRVLNYRWTVGDNWSEKAPANAGD